MKSVDEYAAYPLNFKIECRTTPKCVATVSLQFPVLLVQFPRAARAVEDDFYQAGWAWRWRRLKARSSIIHNPPHRFPADFYTRAAMCAHHGGSCWSLQESRLAYACHISEATSFKRRQCPTDERRCRGAHLAAPGRLILCLFRAHFSSIIFVGAVFVPDERNSVGTKFVSSKYT